MSGQRCGHPDDEVAKLIRHSYLRVMGREAIVAELRNLRPRLNAEGVTHICPIRPTCARKPQRAKRDIDILLNVDPVSRFSILNLVGVESIVAEATGIPANVFMRRSLDEGFRDSIKGDLIEIF
jgi:predicted nucleotidyltransferase